MASRRVDTLYYNPASRPLCCLINATYDATNGTSSSGERLQDQAVRLRSYTPSSANLAGPQKPVFFFAFEWVKVMAKVGWRGVFSAPDAALRAAHPWRAPDA